jgi:hypothetical protein
VVFRVGDTLPNPNSNPIDFLQHCARGSSRESQKFLTSYFLNKLRTI